MEKKVRSKLLELKTNGNSEIGYLSFFESNVDIKFEIKRIYYTYAVPINTKRGMHAHKQLQQALWCPYGTIKIILDDGFEKKTYILDNPSKVLFVGSGVWRDMYWEQEASVLCVAASEHYNEDDYIRDYDLFLKCVKEGYWDNENKF